MNNYTERKNIFHDQPEFIDLDQRNHRPQNYGYAITPEFMLNRHEIIFPPELIRNKKILDLGSCLGATGAWCLSHGASCYHGVEIHEEFVNKSIYCLEKYYSEKSWTISKCSIEEFLNSSIEHFDILVASGIMYGASDVFNLLSLFIKNADFIIIESMQTQTIFHEKILTNETIKMIAQDPHIVDYLENTAYIAVGNRMMVAPDEKTILFPGFNPSMGALKYIMKQLGFDCNINPYLALKKRLPEYYSPLKRFALYFSRNKNLKTREFGLKNAIDDPLNIINEINWKDDSL